MSSFKKIILIILSISSFILYYIVSYFDKNIDAESIKLTFKNQRVERRDVESGFCTNIYENVPLPSSTCWNWNEDDDHDNILKQKGCDNQACQDAVCTCDPYCCETSWDLSCRGYYQYNNDSEIIIMDNFFTPGCSASILCCEEGGNNKNTIPNKYSIKASSTITKYENVLAPAVINFEQEQRNDENFCENLQTNSPEIGSNCWDWTNPEINYGTQKGCDHEKCAEAVCACDPFCCSDTWDLSCRGFDYDLNGTIIFGNPWVPGCYASVLCCEPEESKPSDLPTCEKNNWHPPDDSNCWEWDQEDFGITSQQQLFTTNQNGCDFNLCQEAVCACDPYCCEISWDLSCRGFQINDNSELNDNPYSTGCSASILCCEPETAFPKPPPFPVLPTNRTEPPQPVLPPSKSKSTGKSDGRKSDKNDNTYTSSFSSTDSPTSSTSTRSKTGKGKSKKSGREDNTYTSSFSSTDSPTSSTSTRSKTGKGKSKKSGREDNSYISSSSSKVGKGDRKGKSKKSDHGVF